MMIVPAKPKHYDREFWDPKLRKKGETFHIDSGMGGSFEVELVEITDTKFVFEIIKPEWKFQGPYTYTPEQAVEKVYCLVPDWP